MRAASTRPRGATLGVPLIFALSGAAALMLETVWSRWLALSLGSATHATAIVLACFMGGLGFGSWIAGRWADRVGVAALRGFAWAEIAIGVWALVSAPLFTELLPHASADLARAFGWVALPSAGRAAIATVLLAIPTVLMGATLPLLARWIVSSGASAGTGIGSLYALNTWGGAAGTLFATFFAIERWGLSGTVQIAGVFDLSVGLLVLWWGRHAGSPAPSSDAKSPVEARPLDRSVAIPLAAYFITGFIGLALEVSFYRVLVTLVGASVYAFSVMLAAFLIGLASGSSIGTRLAARAQDPRNLLVYAFGLLAVGSGIAICLLQPDLQLAIRNGARAVPWIGGTSFGGELALCLAGLLPASIALGLVVPVIARVAERVPGNLARTFGAAYALNTLGAVAGTLSAHLLLIPWIGTAGAVRLLAWIATLCALVIGTAWRPRAISALLAITGLALSWGVNPAREAVAQQAIGMEQLAFHEGPVQTVMVARSTNEELLDHLRLISNRSTLTGTQYYAQRYMRLLGHLPALLASQPRRALVICLGTGMTAGAVVLHPSIESLDIAEISPEVAATEVFFRDANGGVLSNPKTTLHLEDGRHLLLTAERPWDLITLEPPPPRDAGVVSLYTREFYELAAARLTAGGVVAQWIPLHSQSLREMQMEVAAFLAVFPHAIGAIPVERELLLFGSNQPLPLSTERLARMNDDPAVLASLTYLGFSEPAELLSIFYMDREALLRFAGDADVLCDDRPLVEYYLRFGKQPPRPDASQFLLEPAPFSGADAPAAERARSALTDFLQGWFLHYAGQAQAASESGMRALAARPDDPYFLWTLRISDAHLRKIEERAARTADPAAWVDAAYRWLDRRRPNHAASAAWQALALDSTNAPAREILTQIGGTTDRIDEQPVP